MNYCKHCGEKLSGTVHTCTKTGHTYRVKEDAYGDFILSAVIGAATGSAIIGGLLGRDIVGGIVGDLLDGDLWD